jgi:hypothetical protein
MAPTHPGVYKANYVEKPNKLFAKLANGIKKNTEVDNTN